MKKRFISFLFIIGLATCKTVFIWAQDASQNAVLLSDKKKADMDAKLLNIPKGYTKNLHWDLLLDPVGKNGSTITWKSGNPAYISNKGKLLKRSPRGGAKVKVTMTAIVSAGAEKRTRTFNIHIAREEQSYDGYLFAC
jgi:uncharacterized membrane protein